MSGPNLKQSVLLVVGVALAASCLSGCYQDRITEWLCERGVGPACFNSMGRAFSREPREALKTLERLCRKRNLPACEMAAICHQRGQIADLKMNDPRKLLRLFRGKVRFVKIAKDPEKALELYEIGCRLGGRRSCHRGGRLVYYGREVAQDYKKARLLLDKACTLGEKSSCHLVGLLYRDGKGVPRDLVRAAKLWARACDADHQLACCELGFLHERKGRVFDLALSRRYRVRACRLSPADCGPLAGMYVEGKGVKRDLDQARRLYALSCRKGGVRACCFLGRLYQREDYRGRSPDKARRVFERGCRKKAGWCCHRLALMLEQGRGGKKDASRAAGLKARACRLRFRPACPKGGK